MKIDFGIEDGADALAAFVAVLLVLAIADVVFLLVMILFGGGGQ